MVICFRPTTLLKKETQAQVFSCEFCKISKNTFFTEPLRATASELSVKFDNYQFLNLLLHLHFHLNWQINGIYQHWFLKGYF